MPLSGFDLRGCAFIFGDSVHRAIAIDPSSDLFWHKFFLVNCFLRFGGFLVLQGVRQGSGGRPLVRFRLVR